MSEPVDAALVTAELRARRDHARSAFERAAWSFLVDGRADAFAGIVDDLTSDDVFARAGWSAVALALLAGDDELAARGASAALPHVDQYVPGFRDYVAAMLALTRGDDALATARLAALEAFITDHDKLRSGHPAGVAAIPRGLVHNEPATVENGIETLLAWHVRRVRARSDVFNSPRAVVCVDAVAALVLAHRRGMDLEVAQKYRAATVPLLALHISEWDGRPLPRSVRIQVTADLVVGQWLRQLGIGLEQPAAGAAPSRRARPSTRRRRDSDVDVGHVIEALHQRLETRKGSPWQLASWATMLSDVAAARRALRDAALVARQRWRSVGGHHNDVREHFAYALVLADDAALGETIPQLQAWMASGGGGLRRYAHAHGCLDLICDVLAGVRPTRADVEAVVGPFASIRVACVALVERDSGLLTEGLEEMLDDHVGQLERKSSPPPPLCEWAIYVAVAATRLGIPVSVDERYANHLVPIEVGPQRLVGRMPCDLLGTAVWRP